MSQEEQKLNTVNSAQNDFYMFVNNDWLQQNPIPSDYNRWGTFEVLVNDTNAKVKNIFDKEDDYTNVNWSKVKTMWKQGNDELTLNSINESSPITSFGLCINNILEIQSLENLNNTICNLTRYGCKTPLTIEASPDLKNSAVNICWFDRNGLGLPDRDYYFLDSMEDKRNAYKKFLTDMLTYVSTHLKLTLDVEQVASNIYSLEHTLAGSQMTMADRRDPHKIYNILSLDELLTQFPNINWNNLFALNDVNVSGQKICVQELEYFTKLNELFGPNGCSLETWKYYLLINLYSSFSQYMDDNISNICFNFYGTVLSGQTEQKPRWKRVMSTINDVIGQLVGKKYSDEFFPEESKNAALEMIHNMLKTFNKRIDNLTWMSQTTKDKAKEKLSKFTVKIGYPDKWDNFDNLTVSDDVSYCTNVMRCNLWKTEKNLKMCYKPVDKFLWQMNVFDINAYYDPSQNEIVFPAGILQAPFFDKDATFAQNYGGIGSVINHEISHSLDDTGSQFDGDGNLNNWWTSEDKENYNNAIQKMVEQFNNFVMEGMHLNGNMCLGENTADFGGVTVALDTLVTQLTEIKHENINDEIKRFFMSYATVWRNNIRPDALKSRIVTDPHSPGYYRVNGILQNVPEFYTQYNIGPNDKMYLDPEKRTVLW